MSSSPRLAGLDAARAVAVLAMVMGHSLDAVLSAAARATPALHTYWQVRTFTAPLFLLVSGWAVMTSLSRLDLSGLQVVKRYLPRVGLLFFLGFFLRWPAWDMWGLIKFDRAVWQHFLAFDALHCIAASLLVGLWVLAVAPPGWKRIVALGSLALAVPFATRAVWGALSPEGTPLVLQQVLGGGVSPFPLFPWSAYFFAGALAGAVCNRLERIPHKVIFLLAAGTIAMAVTGSTPTAHMHPTSVLLFSWRLGVPLLILAGSLVLPQAVARALAPVGRASLWVYVIHLPIAYGWALWPGLASRVGQTLDPLPALGVALLVTGVSVVLALGGKRLKRLIRRPKTLATTVMAEIPSVPLPPATSDKAAAQNLGTTG